MTTAPPAPRVLIVDDDEQLRRFLSTTLAGHAFRVVEAATLAEAAAAAEADTPDLILLDLGLPDGDGIDLVHRLRVWTTVPILVLSARGREEDKVAALDAGANDYLTKPFGVRELFARIRVALRHGRTGPPDVPVHEVGPIRLDDTRHEVAVSGAPVHLTPIEYKLLAQLIRNAGKLLTYQQLLTEIWGPNAVDRVHYLRVHMASLRRKIEVDPARPAWLITEPGVGYRLRDAPP
jgi:two-component system KDP operon response regulator KdpE